MSWLGRLFGRKKTEAPKEVPLKDEWRDKKYGFTEYELLVLSKLKVVGDILIDGWEIRFTWCGDQPANKVAHCPHCKGPIVELYRSSKPTVKETGIAIMPVQGEGLFCLRCGAELVCADCEYKAGDRFVGNAAHWTASGIGHVKYRIKVDGRDLRNVIYGRWLVGQKQLELKPTDEPPRLSDPEHDIQDEYAKLEARLTEIAAEKLELEEEILRIHERQREINIVFEAEALELAEPPKELAAAADGDKEIIAEAEAEVAQLAPAADEGEK